VSDAARLQDFLRATAAPGQDVVHVPPFTAYFNPGDSLKYLNYAIPDGDVEPDRGSIQRLRREFVQRDRLPRLEWIEEAAPRVAPALGDAGLAEELRAPLMACAPDELVEPDPGVDDLRVVPVSREDLRDMTNVQQVAFGGRPLGEGDEPRPPRGGAVLARVGEKPASAAAWTPVIDGISEIVGVATAEDWRRRGLAGAVTAAATRAAFDAGATMCVLSPGNETAQGVYARAGFRRVATMLHWSDSSGA
jgi:ribosomal protein S18 acetylase RimI-like enzyme